MPPVGASSSYSQGAFPGFLTQGGADGRLTSKSAVEDRLVLWGAPGRRHCGGGQLGREQHREG
jgi:hypothetical protein